jgi:hypothetical protein
MQEADHSSGAARLSLSLLPGEWPQWYHQRVRTEQNKMGGKILPAARSEYSKGECEMTIEQGKRALFMCSVLMALWIFAAGRLSGQRNWHQGDTWLEWKHNARESYVFGYIVGYSTGRWDGCGEGAKDSAREANPGDESDRTHRCRHQGPDFSKNMDYFVKTITDFYERYPEDREIDIGEVFEQLGNGLTLEQIHSHPFPRRNPPNSKP